MQKPPHISCALLQCKNCTRSKKKKQQKKIKPKQTTRRCNRIAYEKFTAININDILHARNEAIVVAFCIMPVVVSFGSLRSIVLHSINYSFSCGRPKRIVYFVLLQWFAELFDRTLCNRLFNLKLLSTFGFTYKRIHFDRRCACTHTQNGN